MSEHSTANEEKNILEGVTENITFEMRDANGDLIVAIKDKDVVIGEKYEMAEAAKRFWENIKELVFQDKTNVNSVGPDFLVDSGLLFKINQRILHPFGLAMSVAIHDDGWATFGKIWDYREDVEGMIFEQETLEDGKKKYDDFMEEWGNKKLEERKKFLGYVVQE